MHFCRSFFAPVTWLCPSPLNIPGFTAHLKPKNLVSHSKVANPHSQDNLAVILVASTRRYRPVSLVRRPRWARHAGALELTVNVANPNNPKLRKASPSSPLIECPDTIDLGDGDSDPLADPNPRDPSKFALPDAGECGLRRCCYAWATGAAVRSVWWALVNTYAGSIRRRVRPDDRPSIYVKRFVKRFPCIYNHATVD